MGHIDCWYKLKNIENNYNKKYINNNALDIINNGYNLFLSVMIMDIKTNFSFYKDILDSSQFSLYFSEFANIYEDILLNFKTLEYKFDILKDITFEINYKLDFEIRRKASNLIVKEIINKYHDNLYNLNVTNYRLTYSLNNIKKKIKEINEKKIDDENLKKELEQSFIKCEKQIIDNANKEIENFEFNNFEKENNDIIFINKDDSENEKKKVILLNLFYLLRKDLNNRFNYYIHNETHKINSVLENDNLQNKKEKEKKKEKNDNKNTEKENNKNNILCKEKLKIINQINNNITTKKKKSTINEEIQKLLIYIKKDYKSIIPFLSQNEFINFLENIKRLYNINFKGNLTNSINLMIFGEKRNLLTEYKIYNNKEMIKNEIEKLKEKIEKDNDLKKILKKINKILNRNIKDLNEILMEELDTLEQYKNYYDINFLLKNIGSNNINPHKLIKNKFDYLLNENRFLIFIIIEILILEDYINEICKIKNNIKKINLNEIDKQNKIKIEIINYFKSSINTNYVDNIANDIWNEYRNKKEFLINEDIKIKELDEEIKSYVKKKNVEDFVKEFIEFFENEIPEIDFTQKDPQNLDILAFMKQNQLDAFIK